MANPRNFGNHVTVRPSVSTTGIPSEISNFLINVGAFSLCLT